MVRRSPAEKLAEKTDDEILRMALKSLSVTFNLELDFLKSELRSSHIFNWTNEAFAEGAYSYALPGTKKARKKLKEPVEGTLFFAGEGLYDGDSLGTVESALANGKEAALKILSLEKAQLKK